MIRDKIVPAIFLVILCGLFIFGLLRYRINPFHRKDSQDKKEQREDEKNKH